MTIAVILAGGTGKRMGAQVPKQFLKVGEKTIIEFTIDAFEKNALVDTIAVVMHQDYFTTMENIIANSKWNKVRAIISGGTERSDSSYNAIRFFSNHKDAKIIFHDAVRPMVSDSAIDNVIKALDRFNAVMTAIPTTDTIAVAEGGFVKSVPDRNTLMRVQTPQAFRFETIKEAYDIALTDPGFVCTDDCGVVKKYLPDEPIAIIRGDERNIKITYPEDLKYLKE
ncbi:MAG: 2-C-methyl-D-erythritol 4-phosphate cytidylyltransferase [Bacteroidales bacterium]|nr:2-C-methyl-D-erythritol 4-phosphate cytidylyltransferase [Bacteroidales bacterium]MBR5651943.1 2-C-methyl-D-erythritol 4-phosphate cytidylyltransferase [Bacteroidales bacterium]MBR5663114.1 2-C-methyl-D-erythritol 4-phosphate cytidylyltransferase [Bacteroidales bacterium]